MLRPVQHSGKASNAVQDTLTRSMVGLLARSCLVALAAWSTSVRAQETPATGRAIVVQNLAPFARQEGVSVVVPFARGAVAELPDLHVEGRATVWQPIGARWPDGSLRQALCLFRDRLAALDEHRLTLAAGAGPAPDDGPIELPAASFAVEVTQNGTTTIAEPKFVRWLEDNAARRVALLSARVGSTGLIAELILERWAGQAHGSADVAVFFSDPGTPALSCAVDSVSVRTTGMAFLLRHQLPLAVDNELLADGNRLTLLRGAVLGDGQGIRRTGVLVPPLRGDGAPEDSTSAAAATCPLLAATSWVDSGAFGPFGYVPEVPPWLAGNALRTTLAARHRAFVLGSQQRGDPFRDFPFGLARFAGQTGDQRDFGIVKLEAVAATGLPSFLLEVELSVLQEACRPVHNFTTDGAPLQARDRPQWIVWAGRTHWHCGVSTDRLGKPCPVPNFETHGWTGKDREHWSSNYLCAFYLLTGKHWALREIENEVQLYLSGQTIDPKLTTSGSGAPRGVGRTLHTACWLHQCTGDTTLLQRMNERLDQIYWPGWKTRVLPETNVRPLATSHPDGRLLDGKTFSWAPWQESLAAIGFEAAHRTTGNANARALAEGLALNTLRHGWLVDERTVIIATAIRWIDGGVPPSDEELARGDRSIVQWSTGTAFSVWAIGAVELARGYAQARGEQALVDKAERILRFLRERREVPRDGWFDRFGEWDAVR